jgi:hypothetical protein
MTDFDRNKFNNQLAETLAWCTRSGLPQDQTLSTSLHVIKPTTLYDNDEYEGLPLDFRLNQLAESVFAERSKLLTQMNIAVPPITNDLKGGRLSLFLPSGAFAMDGVMQMITNGFFHYCDEPPLDTWVYHMSEPSDKDQSGLTHYLISWIPPQLFSLVEKAMRTNCDDWSTKWIDKIVSLDAPDFWDAIRCYNTG